MADLLKERIARHLRAVRRERDLIQEEVARAVGVTGRQLQRWEGAVSMPTWRNIQSLAEVLGVEPSVVAGIVGPDEQVSERDQLARVQSDMAVVQARVVTLSAEVSALRELLGVTTPAVRPLAPSSADGRAA